jgi:hypothetical protein
MPPQLSIAELYTMKNNKDKIKTNTFNVIIEKCHSKIKSIAAQGGMNIFYEIPFIMLGFPLYDIYECVDYIVKSLRDNGLLVQILGHPNHNTIYVSWKPSDISTHKQLTSSMSSHQDTTIASSSATISSPFKSHPFGIRPKKML